MLSARRFPFSLLVLPILLFTAKIAWGLGEELSETKDQLGLKCEVSAVTMSQNKLTVEKYMEAFRKTDHAAILSCLTNDVEWVIPGMFHTIGKEAFDKEIENDAFVGSPKITVTRMTEEQNVVVAEGNVQSAKKDGGQLNVVFCDVFELHEAKIKTPHIVSHGNQRVAYAFQTVECGAAVDMISESTDEH